MIIPAHCYWSDTVSAGQFSRGSCGATRLLFVNISGPDQLTQNHEVPVMRCSTQCAEVLSLDTFRGNTDTDQFIWQNYLFWLFGYFGSSALLPVFFTLCCWYDVIVSPWRQHQVRPSDRKWTNSWTRFTKLIRHQIVLSHFLLQLWPTSLSVVL